MTAVGARNRKKATAKIQKRKIKYIFFILKKIPLKLLLKSKIRIPKSESNKIPKIRKSVFFLTDFCKNPNPNPSKKFDGLPSLENIVLVQKMSLIFEVTF